MTAANERLAVGTIFTGWTGPQIEWPNQQNFTKPTKAAWLSVSIQGGASSQLELGGDRNVHRHVGIVVVSVFAPEGWGDKTALDWADTVAARFRRYRQDFTDGSIVFRSPSIRAVGVDAGYYQVNVSTPFVCDDLF